MQIAAEVSSQEDSIPRIVAKTVKEFSCWYKSFKRQNYQKSAKNNIVDNNIDFIGVSCFGIFAAI